MNYKYYDGLKQGNYSNYPWKEEGGEGPDLNMMDREAEETIFKLRPEK